MAEIARDRAEEPGDLAMATRIAMLLGRGGLTAEAQTRILALRERAYGARIAAVRQSSRMIEDQPVIAGVIGMAIGAAVVAALPPSATEDRLFGSERDRLMRRAKEALRQERARTADAAARLAGKVASEPLSDRRQLASEAL